MDSARRSFLKSFVAGTLSLADELRGTPQLRLDELDQVPEAVLRTMVPVFRSDGLASIKDGWLLIRHWEDGELRRYRPVDEREAYMLACFDGRHSIDGICNLFQAEFQFDREAAFSTVKRLFVQLAEAGICQPAGGLG
ncbi:MAG: hypothetical protein P4L42_15030 [Desulfocapsaceae bacterium]|nr:hypothetical protein [Desulfocapsaceae bacterium]